MTVATLGRRGIWMSNAAPPDVLSDSLRRLVVLGYITAVAIPPIGCILGGL